MCPSDKQQLQHPYPWDGINSGLSMCTSIKCGHISVFILFWAMNPWSHETLQASMTAVMFVSMVNAGQCLWLLCDHKSSGFTERCACSLCTCIRFSKCGKVVAIHPVTKSVASFGRRKKRMAAMVSQIPLHPRLVFHLQLTWKCPDSMSRVLSGLTAVKVNMFRWQMTWHPDVTKRERERGRRLNWDACCHTDLDFLSLSPYYKHMEFERLCQAI